MLANVIGLPFEGIEQQIDQISLSYGQLLHNTNGTGHAQPSGNIDIDSPYKRIDHNPFIGNRTEDETLIEKNTCHEFLNRSENLAFYTNRSNYPVGAESIPYPLERAIYGWLYEDSGSHWGHRETALLQDKDLQNQSTENGFNNNYSSTKNEGFIGIYVEGSQRYQPFENPNPDLYQYRYSVVVVMNLFDPIDTQSARQRHCNYPVLKR